MHLRQTTLEVTLGCLLHDVGKLCFRAGESGTHSASGYAFLKQVWREQNALRTLDCLRWHHAAELRRALPEADSPAYIACVADNISAAADRRETGEEGGFSRYLPLAPVFTHLNGEHGGFSLSAKPQDGTLRLPRSDAAKLTEGDYAELCRKLAEELRELPAGEDWVNSLLAVLEGLTSAVPSSTNTGESPDVSLYDHMKISAAVGACIAEYCAAEGVTDYRAAVWESETAFRAKRAFLLYSADFSGIQSFLFTVSTTNALRSLRSRSFFLELAMEHYIDELLSSCGVSRANLLYAGGGHCYVLLPNTAEVRERLERWNARFNDWLLHEFGLELYLADGWAACSADELTNTPAEASPYQAMFAVWEKNPITVTKKWYNADGEEISAPAGATVTFQIKAKKKGGGTRYWVYLDDARTIPYTVTLDGTPDDDGEVEAWKASFDVPILPSSFSESSRAQLSSPISSPAGT